MDLLEIMRQRRSVRSYTSEDVSEENIRKILEAGLLSASGRAIRPWELIVVKERAVLQKMAERVSQVMKLQGQIRILPGGGEDWKLPADQGEETRQEGEGLNA